MNGVNDYDNFDGPTSAYVKRNRKTSFAYKFKKMLYERKKYPEWRICNIIIIN